MVARSASVQRDAAGDSIHDGIFNRQPVRHRSSIVIAPSSCRGNATASTSRP
jgi:hypothetical protein